jgi:hypothetical protein
MNVYKPPSDKKRQMQAKPLVFRALALLTYMCHGAAIAKNLVRALSLSSYIAYRGRNACQARTAENALRERWGLINNSAPMQSSFAIKPLVFQSLT